MDEAVVLVSKYFMLIIKVTRAYINDQVCVAPIVEFESYFDVFIESDIFPVCSGILCRANIRYNGRWSGEELAGYKWSYGGSFGAVNNTSAHLTV